MDFIFSSCSKTEILPKFINGEEWDMVGSDDDGKL